MKKLIKSLGMKLFITTKEKTYNYSGHSVKYLLKKGNTNELCVVFSAFPKLDDYPKYNYVKTLWGGGVQL